jgi:nucleotide-binding universal stress UspA family protein
MLSSHDVLIAVDESEASMKAVEYVASVVRSAPHFHIRLLHVLPHIPTGLLEHGGRSNPERLRAVSHELDEQTTRWQKRCEAAAADLVAAARTVLEEAGVGPDRIVESFAAPLPEETIGYHILKAAVDASSDTVVVGRAPRSWFSGVLHRSPSEVLLRGRARGIAVWIVT